MKILVGIKRVIHNLIYKLKLFCLWKMHNNYEHLSCLNEKKDLKLFFTHNYGGGTKEFEKNYLCKNENVAVVRRLGFEFMKDSFFQIEVVFSGQIERKFLIKQDKLAMMFTYDYYEIIVNSLFSYRCYTEIQNMIKDYKIKNKSTTVSYYMHDFHCICPKVNLCVDKHFCNFECEQAKCKFEFVEDTISDWRKNWETFFFYVDEIRCFSESSKDIFELVYKDMSDKIKVCPHDMSYCKNKPIPNIQNLPLHIGICGYVSSIEKGNFVCDSIVKKFGSQIPITFVGTNRKIKYLAQKKVKCLGKYKRDDLQRIIEKEKISLIIFPSICPETFSYLVSELIMMDIPIISFDLGAQAEKLKAYEKGKVCQDVNQMLDLIEKYRIHLENID